MPVILDDSKIAEMRKSRKIDRQEFRDLTRPEKKPPPEPDKSDLLIKQLKAIAETSGESVKLSKQVFDLLIQVIESLRDRPVVVEMPNMEKAESWEAFNRGSGRWHINVTKWRK